MYSCISHGFIISPYIEFHYLLNFELNYVCNMEIQFLCVLHMCKQDLDSGFMTLVFCMFSICFFIEDRGLRKCVLRNETSFPLRQCLFVMTWKMSCMYVCIS